MCMESPAPMKRAIRLDRLLRLLGSVALVGCGLFPRGQKYIPDQYIPQPIEMTADGLTIAVEVAYRWDEGAYLVGVGSVFEYAGEEYQLKHSFYDFVSENGQRYIGVVIDSSGAITVNPPADVEGSLIPTTIPYALSDNDFQERQAVNLAWSLLQEDSIDSCEQPQRISVQGRALGDGSGQVWSLDYVGDNRFLGRLTLDAESGEPIFVDAHRSICLP
jgi:hypothetical protein